jgi:protein transport protein SEC20
MASNDISSSLNSLITAHKQTLLLIHRLQRLPAQPGPSSSEADVRAELSAEIHQSLKELEEEFELLKQEIEGFPSAGSARRRSTEREQERERIVSAVAKLGEDLKLYGTQFICLSSTGT